MCRRASTIFQNDPTTTYPSQSLLRPKIGQNNSDGAYGKKVEANVFSPSIFVVFCKEILVIKQNIIPYSIRQDPKCITLMSVLCLLADPQFGQHKFEPQ